MLDEVPSELEDYYYLDHFFEMLDFVMEHNEALLDSSHLDFVRQFRKVPRDAQGLFVRMANRKGRAFRIDRLEYREISDMSKSIEDLRSGRLVREPGNEEFSDWLNLMTRAELIDLIQNLPFVLADSPQLGSASKTGLISFIMRTYPFETVREYACPAIVVEYADALDYLIYLYFGSLREGLTAFTLRDLGIRKTRSGKQNYRPRFDSREVALAAFHYHRTRHRIRSASPDELVEMVDEAPLWIVVDDADAIVSRNRTINLLGRSLERQQEPELALFVYLLSNQFPATERAVRLHYQLGEREEAKQLLRSLIDDPSSDEELIFAEDFYERKFGERKVGRLTEMLRGAEVLALNELGRENPEAAAVAYFEETGAEAFHVENLVWSQLFGIVFWDLLFEKQIHSEFDLMPAGLGTANFYGDNEAFIEERLAGLEDPDWIDQQISRVEEQIESVPNYLVDPAPELFECVRKLADLAPRQSLQVLLRELARDFRANRSGFPDLLVIENDGVRLVEVKAEGDQIQRNQLVQMERLRRAGFDVSVVKIQWVVDPEQEYVVVDLETTGGNPAWHRVTEIGAVKVKGGKIVDQWSTLVNPERTIPANIVRLTGITEEMVVDAPKFSEVGDRFREFLGEGIFVAHRASFDYGFLREEYARLEEGFSAPTLCTVVESRRHFPGLSSYGLAKLSKYFGIPLVKHHRALCDARATAELLILINQRRTDKLSSS